jgi:hypothetical protein
LPAAQTGLLIIGFGMVALFLPNACLLDFEIGVHGLDRCVEGVAQSLDLPPQVGELLQHLLGRIRDPIDLLAGHLLGAPAGGIAQLRRIRLRFLTDLLRRQVGGLQRPPGLPTGPRDQRRDLGPVWRFVDTPGGVGLVRLADLLDRVVGHFE